MKFQAIDIDGHILFTGDRVERVLGTGVDGLFGHIRYIEDGRSEATCLVAIEGPGEPGIGHQFYCPLSHLRFAPQEPDYDGELREGGW